METMNLLANVSRYKSASVPILNPFTGYTYRLSNSIGEKITNCGDSIAIYKATKNPPLVVKNVKNNNFVAVETGPYKDSFDAKRNKNLEVNHDNILRLQTDFLNPDNLYVGEYELMDIYIVKGFTQQFLC